MEKMTIKDYFMEVREIVANAEIENEKRNRALEFIDSRIAQVTAKNSKRSNKPTKAQTENAILAEKVIEVMPAGTALTVSQIQKAVPALAELSNQRATAVIRYLVQIGRLARTEEKGKAYFTLV
jgi:Fic family protein